MKLSVTFAGSLRVKEIVVPIGGRRVRDSLGSSDPIRKIRCDRRRLLIMGRMRSGTFPLAPGGGIVTVGVGVRTPVTRATLLAVSRPTQSVLFGPVVICRGPAPVLNPVSVVCWPSG